MVKAAASSRDIPWLLPTENERYGRFHDDVDQLLTDRDVVVTPLIAGRVEEIAILDILIQRLLGILKTLVPADQTVEKVNRDIIACIETLLRALEKWRKAMNELEEGCAKAGTPIDLGIADKVKPMLRQTQGVMGKALQRGRAQPRKGKTRRAALTSEQGNALS